MCTIPSPISNFWQFFISWLGSALIKCLFLNMVSRFSGMEPENGASVAYSEDYARQQAQLPGYVFFALTHRSFPAGLGGPGHILAEYATAACFLLGSSSHEQRLEFSGTKTSSQTHGLCLSQVPCLEGS